MLLLRGARSPYLLVDRASEIARAPGSGGEARWMAAVCETRAAGDDADAVLTLALSWLEAPERALRQTALRVLVAQEGAVPSTPGAPCDGGFNDPPICDPFAFLMCEEGQCQTVGTLRKW